VCLRDLIACSGGRTQAGRVGGEGAEEDVGTSEGGGDRRLEETANDLCC
jgi:hypothetical protein